MINASSGYDAAVIGDAADHSESRLGRVRFGVEALRRLRRARPPHVVVRVDGERLFVGRAMSAIVMNAGQRASASIDVAPDARMDDGVLDVAVSRVADVGSALCTVGRIVARRLVPDSDLLRAQGASIEVDWVVDQPVQRDGDVIGSRAALRYVVAPGALTLVSHPDVLVSEM